MSKTVKANPSKLPYLHGFSKREQDRLRTQAQVAEQWIYSRINPSGVRNLLEVGMGVGAQTEILLRRYPQMKITGIDLNEKQLEAAKASLSKLPGMKGRWSAHEMNATSMDFSAGEFDGAFMCFVLEHIPQPERVLAEVRRVLSPGSPVVITEVMNFTFFLDPYSPNLWKYWMAFNDYQYDQKGDPFIGAKLGNLLLSQGFRSIHTRPVILHFDNREPSKRKEMILQMSDLLLGAAEKLVKAKYVTTELAKKAHEELESAARNPNAVLYDSFMQAQAIV